MVQVELEHVKGHQDNKLLGPLTRDAMLNVKADHMARTKLLEHTNGPNQFHIPWSQGVCYTGTQRVEKKFGNHIRDHINGLVTRAYWEKRWALTEGI